MADAEFTAHIPGIPPWISRHAQSGPKVIFQWTRVDRARYAGYSAEGYAHFPLVVIAGSVYTDEQAARLWDEQCLLGESDFFPSWEAAVAWLHDDRGAYKFPLPTVERVTDDVLPPRSLFAPVIDLI